MMGGAASRSTSVLTQGLLCAPVLGRLLGCKALGLGELAQHEIKLEVAHPGGAGQQVPLGSLHHVRLHSHAVGVESREAVLSDRIAFGGGGLQIEGAFGLVLCNPAALEEHDAILELRGAEPRVGRAAGPFG